MRGGGGAGLTADLLGPNLLAMHVLCHRNLSPYLVTCVHFAHSGSLQLCLPFMCHRGQLR